MWTVTNPVSSGPHAAEPDLAECARIIRQGSRSFHAASLLLPGDVRAGARALYAFCRIADDRVDDCGDPEGSLADLRQRLADVYAGKPRCEPVDRAFAWAVSVHGIPEAVPQALLEGFAWDAAGRRYQTLEDLIGYAVRVAGTVGVMMSLVMGVRGPYALARAIDLGIAMQLTNIARDVGEDARLGRCYLPQDWLSGRGVTEADLAEAALSAADAAEAQPAGPAWRDLVRRLLDEADVFYQSGISGVALLPSGCRPAIRAAGLIYQDIGRSIARADYDTLSRRAYVSSRRKLALLAQANFASAQYLPPLAAPVAAAEFLIEAVTKVPVPRCCPPALGGGWPWVMDLFMDLDTRKARPGFSGRSY